MVKKGVFGVKHITDVPLSVYNVTVIVLQAVFSEKNEQDFCQNLMDLHDFCAQRIDLQLQLC